MNKSFDSIAEAAAKQIALYYDYRIIKEWY